MDAPTLLHSTNSSEDLLEIVCKLQYPSLTLHHDAMISSFSLDVTNTVPLEQPLPCAPRVANDRVKVHWSEDGIDAYKYSISDNLTKLRETWLNSSSPSSIAILLRSTNSLLRTCATETNRFTYLASPPRQRRQFKPKYLIWAEESLRRSHRILRKMSPRNPCYTRVKLSHMERKHNYLRLSRYRRHQDNFKRDSMLNSICSNNPFPSFRALKKIRSVKVERIQKLYVGKDAFEGQMVPDGMFESIRRLKNEPVVFESVDHFPDYSEEYRHILDICNSAKKIPPLTLEKTRKILHSLKKNVNDFFSITALHYINAGDPGIEHFHFLLNALIENVNLSGLQELNTVYACILYKGHQKDRSLARSYRTISTCPILTKALDVYVKELSFETWAQHQAETQYQ